MCVNVLLRPIANGVHWSSVDYVALSVCFFFFAHLLPFFSMVRDTCIRVAVTSGVKRLRCSSIDAHTQTHVRTRLFSFPFHSPPIPLRAPAHVHAHVHMYALHVLSGGARGGHHAALLHRRDVPRGFIARMPRNLGGSAESNWREIEQRRRRRGQVSRTHPRQVVLPRFE